MSVDSSDFSSISASAGIIQWFEKCNGLNGLAEACLALAKQVCHSAKFGSDLRFGLQIFRCHGLLQTCFQNGFGAVQIRHHLIVRHRNNAVHIRLREKGREQTLTRLTSRPENRILTNALTGVSVILFLALLLTKPYKYFLHPFVDGAFRGFCFYKNKFGTTLSTVIAYCHSSNIKSQTTKNKYYGRRIQKILVRWC